MFLVYNAPEIKARGGTARGNDSFEIVVCENCRCQYLYNSELLDLFYDPEDLSVRYLYAEGDYLPPCRQCSAEDWHYLELSPSDNAEVESGPWSWTLT